MKLLLDTHALLWWLADDATLGERARAEIADERNPVFVSAATIWEIRIKQALGKLELPDDFKAVLASQPFLSLGISAEHAHAVADLPPVHRDSFDRMLIAQAQVEDMTVVTRDKRFTSYAIALLEA